MSIERAKSLMGINESKSTKQSSHLTNITEAKDGNTYAIVKENSEYVVKVLDKGNNGSDILSYNYIGGLANKRNFVYESHRTAVKQLSAKVSLISETYGTKLGLMDGFSNEEMLGEYDDVSEESKCNCGGDCKCNDKGEEVFKSEEVFEGYNNKESFSVATSRDIVEMLNLVSEDWGKNSKQAKLIKKFAVNTVNTKNINSPLNESQLHKFNNMLSKMGFINYSGNVIIETLQELEEEKYKLKLDVPTEKDDEGEESFDTEEEFDSADFDFGDDSDEMEGEKEDSGDSKPFDDEPFDAGVEANEEEDPKKFIQQLAGKLGQSIRDYTSDLENPDFELEKFAINSVVSATNTADMPEDDQEDIIDKIKESGEGDDNGEVSDENGSEEEIKIDDKGSEKEITIDDEGSEEGDDNSPLEEGGMLLPHLDALSTYLKSIGKKHASELTPEEEEEFKEYIKKDDAKEEIEENKNKKPDYLDFDKDGDKDEAMTDALKDAKNEKDNVDESYLGEDEYDELYDVDDPTTAIYGEPGYNQSDINPMDDYLASEIDPTNTMAGRKARKAAKSDVQKHYSQPKKGIHPLHPRKHALPYDLDSYGPDDLTMPPSEEEKQTSISSGDRYPYRNYPDDFYTESEEVEVKDSQIEDILSDEILDLIVSKVVAELEGEVVTVNVDKEVKDEYNTADNYEEEMSADDYQAEEDSMGF
jgi:hypothetical protein